MSEGKLNYLQDLLGGLIRMADDVLPGKTGAEKEAWATERLTNYVEANDVAFAQVLVDFTRLPVPAGLVEKLLDNSATDAMQKAAIQMVCKTAIRLAYGTEFMKKYVNREADLTEDEKAEFDKVKKELLAPEESKSEKKGAGK